eukprot:TRINITY_DN49869_c0_g1_i1.p1 TRINITY_DN49869_c0_g1~~TRINITY_DN49869_c0_g1_i1.p1  ORF type:complete len:268 (-),score=33.13 TRINITY_DN49869_c0_g1_i1:21-779(-)
MAPVAAEKLRRCLRRQYRILATAFVAACWVRRLLPVAFAGVRSWRPACRPVHLRAGAAASSQALMAWGPLGPTDAANAVVIQLPFSAPYNFDDTIFTLLSFEAVVVFLCGVLVMLFVQEQIASFERDRMSGKLGDVAAGAAQSLGARLSVIPLTHWFKLFLCIVIDVTGDGSLLLPSMDLWFAPLEGIALKALFGGNVLAVLGFIEEALPFSDVLPTATIAWILQTLAPDNAITRFLGIQPWTSNKQERPKL